jgi:Zn-dependent peptidase ImmA (M78 family)
MKVDFATFGVADKFRIDVRWVDDSEPLERRPKAYGWSIGDLKITVLGQVITQYRRGGASQDFTSWYLLPMLQWLAKNWVELLHEEDFSWTQRSSASAAVAYQEAVAQWISANDDEGKNRYRQVQAWYRRHALRSAAEGGLFPNLFSRRFGDQIELSWTADAPFFAPEGFSFLAEAGVARLRVDDVATPLWELLNWAVACPPTLKADNDLYAWKALSEDVDAIKHLNGQQFSKAYVPADVYALVQSYLTKTGHTELLTEKVSPEKPFVDTLSPAVAMFGGVSPNLKQPDVEFLCSILIAREGMRDSEALGQLVSERESSQLGIPYKDGLSFAEDFLDDIDFDFKSPCVDIRRMVTDLSIEIVEQELETDSIRGVALAGSDFGPTILINLTSKYNESEAGRRFTLAHELCHILYDRSRARRVAHVSGPWVAQGIERRANAFAAYLLMPRDIVVRHVRAHKYLSDDSIHELARTLEVSESSLIEHLYNLEIISEWKRDQWRSQRQMN